MEPELGNKCLLIIYSSLEDPSGIEFQSPMATRVGTRLKQVKMTEPLASGAKFKGTPRNLIMKINNILIFL